MTLYKPWAYIRRFTVFATVTDDVTASFGELLSADLPKCFIDSLTILTQEFVKIKSWLLLIFSISLHNKLKCRNSTELQLPGLEDSSTKQKVEGNFFYGKM